MMLRLPSLSEALPANGENRREMDKKAIQTRQHVVGNFLLCFNIKRHRTMTLLCKGEGATALRRRGEYQVIANDLCQFSNTFASVFAC